MSDKPLRKASLKSLGTIRRKTLSSGDGEQYPLANASFLSPERPLPLVIEPAVEGVDLVQWAGWQRELIERELNRYGAILFRGFAMDSVAVFEQFALALCPELFNENGEHPRQSMSGNVYTPVFYPPEKSLLWHNENSFNQRWPMKLWFGCLKPAATGGQTPLVDSREVFNRLPTQLRKRFIEKQVMYQRNYGTGFGLDWQMVFQTASKAVVEEKCWRDQVLFEWKSGDRLRTLAVRPAVVMYPPTGQLSWFNQAQHWHPACLDAATAAALRAMHAEADLPRNCYYGDGSRIEDAEMEAILQVYRECEVVFSWRAGDVLMLNNLLVAHGRRPYTGERLQLVALGEMTSYEDLR